MLKSSMLILVLGVVLLLGEGIVGVPIEHDDSVSDDLVSQVHLIKLTLVTLRFACCFPTFQRWRVYFQ